MVLQSVSVHNNKNNISPRLAGLDPNFPTRGSVPRQTQKKSPTCLELQKKYYECNYKEVMGCLHEIPFKLEKKITSAVGI